VACPPSFDSTLSSSLSSLSSSLSSRALTYCVVATVTPLFALPPLLPCRHHYPRANTCLIVPLLRQRLVVAMSPLSPRQCLSCPLLLRRRLSCGTSLTPGGCRFANYLDVPPSLLSHRLVVALLPLSLRRSLSLRHLSHCAAVSLGHRPSQPQ
jgi:hypothetical protein